LTALETTARDKTAAWETLAQDLTGNIGRLLPCDAKVTIAINEVTTASEARLSALANYLQAMGQQIGQDSAEAKRIAGANQALGGDLAAEKIETGLEQTAIDGQLAALGESVKTQPGLGRAQTALQQLQAQAQQRGDAIQNGTVQQTLAGTSLKDVVSSADARVAAWKDLQAAYEIERTRWNAYYAARLARAQTECSITRGVVGSSPSSSSSSSSSTKKSKRKQQ
jgi:hypothetical protein